MHLHMQHFDGVAFVHNPYFTGTALREDIFKSQFSVLAQGKAELGDDDSFAHTFWSPFTIELARCGLLEQCLVKALHYLVSRDTGHGGGAILDFRPDRISILDRSGQSVLTGIIREFTLVWLAPYSSDAELLVAETEIQRLLAEALYEDCWDNHSTAQHLRRQADDIKARIIPNHWRPHVLKLLNR